jgi:hypothetical protein
VAGVVVAVIITDTVPVVVADLVAVTDKDTMALMAPAVGVVADIRAAMWVQAAAVYLSWNTKRQCRILLLATAIETRWELLERLELGRYLR